MIDESIKKTCKHCPNFSKHISYSFRSIANQNDVRYSDSTSYFKKYSSSKCKQTVCSHYLPDIHFNHIVKISTSLSSVTEVACTTPFLAYL